MNWVCTFILTTILILISVVQTVYFPPVNQYEYDSYGTLLTMNEHMAIFAHNGKRHFIIIRNPHQAELSRQCTARFVTVSHYFGSYTYFIYSITIGTKQNSNQLVFAYIDEDVLRNVFLTVVFLEENSQGCFRILVEENIAISLNSLNMREHAIVGMDPYGTRIYAVGIEATLVIDLTIRKYWIIDHYNVYGFVFYLLNPFFPKAMIITEDHRAYIVGQQSVGADYRPYLHVLDFLMSTTAQLLGRIELAKFNFGNEAIDITRYTTMSISLNEQSQMLLIGIPHIDTVFILSYNETISAIIVNEHISNTAGIYFGKSVAFLDNNTYAVLAYALPTPPWSESQIQVYSLDGTEVNSRPLVIYPNNQQIIPTMNFKPLPYRIVTVISVNSSIGLVLDVGAALLLPPSPPGSCSSQINQTLITMSVYASVPCMLGTARNGTGISPCVLCPRDMKSNGSGAVECQPCKMKDSLCLRGSGNEVDLNNVSSFDQAYPYPGSPDATEFDDVLLQNIFKFTTNSSHCLAISPLLWASLAIGLGLIIVFVIFLLPCVSKRGKHYQTLIKQVFAHFDLVGEGELWIGGLASLAIIILVIFTCVFSSSFIHLHPIEDISDDERMAISCDSSLLNAKFTTALQLLSILKHEEEQPIFDMLNKQDITLTVQFVSTGFPCTSVSIQENMDRGQEVNWIDYNCSFDHNEFTLSVSTLLPQHQITVQFNLMGPYFVGGLRICLESPTNIQENGKYTVKQLDFCQFFTPFNDTLTVKPVVDVKMTKSINRTAGLSISDDPIFSGIWLPTLSVTTLSDTLLFEEGGEYLRYIHQQLTLVVNIDESEFYVKNEQEPIARQNEIIFHATLFSTMCLGLFGLLFLFSKLTAVPTIQFIQNRYFTSKKQIANNNDDDDETDQIIEEEIEKALKNFKKY